MDTREVENFVTEAMRRAAVELVAFARTPEAEDSVDGFLARVRQGRYTPASA